MKEYSSKIKMLKDIDNSSKVSNIFWNQRFDYYDPNMKTAVNFFSGKLIQKTLKEKINNLLTTGIDDIGDFDINDLLSNNIINDVFEKLILCKTIDCTKANNNSSWGDNQDFSSNPIEKLLWTADTTYCDNKKPYQNNKTNYIKNQKLSSLQNTDEKNNQILNENPYLDY